MSQSPLAPVSYVDVAAFIEWTLLPFLMAAPARVAAEIRNHLASFLNEP